jgi:hypothetical protein
MRNANHSRTDEGPKVLRMLPQVCEEGNRVLRKLREETKGSGVGAVRVCVACGEAESLALYESSLTRR